MVSIDKVRAALPPFENKKKLIVQYQGTRDIINEIIRTHEYYEQDYNFIYDFFDQGDTYTTCSAIWNFLKWHLKYKAESIDEQSVKSPAAILQKGLHVDCKHYSLFAGGVLSAIKDNYLDGFDWCYRFVSEADDHSIGHVFVVVFDGDKEIWLDPVLSSFNQRKKYTYIKDKRVMPLYAISGVNNATVKEISVDSGQAERSFLVMVNLNLFNLKDLLKSSAAVLNGPVKQYFEKNNFDFQNLMNVL